MNEVLKYIGSMLRRTYGAIVDTPMPWRMIDKLASLEEKEEQTTTHTSAAPPQPSSPGGEAPPPPRRSQAD